MPQTNQFILSQLKNHHHHPHLPRPRARPGPATGATTSGPRRPRAHDAVHRASDVTIDELRRWQADPPALAVRGRHHVVVAAQAVARTLAEALGGAAA